MVQYAFSANQFQPRYGSEGGGLPPGEKYKVIIDKTEVLPVKEGNGNMFLAITLKSIEGSTAGQIQVDRLNLYNINPTTVQIAQQQLAAYCVVVGKQGFGDTVELHNIPFLVDIAQQRGNSNYTEVRKLYDINGNEPGKGPAPAQGGPPAGFAPGPGAAQPQPQTFAANGPTAFGAPQGGQTQQPPQQSWSAAPAAAEPAPWSQQPQQQAPAWSPAPGNAAPSWGPR